MKRSVVYMALRVLGLCGLGVTLLHPVPAVGAELNGFAIHTQEANKTVTITLFTDQRVTYATEHQGKQFAIVLPHTQLSPAQLKNGLPVIVDNQNRFIGRAVPGEDGKVRIVLPNLSANDYAVSIQQKHSPTGQSSAEQTPKIRTAFSLTTGNAFEQAVASLPQTKASNAFEAGAAPNLPLNHAGLHRPAVQAFAASSSSRSMIWNPYTVKPAPSLAATLPAPTAENPALLAAESATFRSESKLDSQPLFSRKARSTQLSPLTLPSLGKDPLWYLHTLPTNNESPLQDFKKLAAEDVTLQHAVQATSVKPATAQQQTTPAPTSSQGLVQELKAGFQSLPQWLLVTLAIFLGGIGVFTLVGGLVLLKVLFSQILLQLAPVPLNISLSKLSPTNTPQAQPETTAALLPDLVLSAAAPAINTGAPTPTGKPSPAKAPRSGFQDISRVSALDYLKESPSNVTQAVHNAGLVKFPTQKKNRSRLKSVEPRHSGLASSYNTRP